MEELKVTPLSPGIAIGMAVRKKGVLQEVVQQHGKDSAQEKKRYQAAREAAAVQLEELYAEILFRKGEKEAVIFQAQKEILQDMEFVAMVEACIDENGCNAEWAIRNVQENFVVIFEAMDDEYMRERAIDIKDTCRRVLQILQQEDAKEENVAEQEHENQLPYILVCSDLTPSETARMDKNLILGIISETGGRTSHAAIFANALSIPYVVCPDIMNKVADREQVAFDGENGELILSPDEISLNRFQMKMQELKQELLALERYKEQVAATGDNFEIMVMGNIGSHHEATAIVEHGGNGIGLFRTEFLYMDQQGLPSEEVQFLAYRETLEKMQGRPVIIRTLDIGGDKEIPYLNIAKEENPFLGCRAIRYCLKEPELWKVQLRALLRAGVYGNLHLMIPMMSSLSELRAAKKLLEDAKKELRAEGVPFLENPLIGMMMETPAAAVMADVFAREVDFFSIGTNDLTQYIMAADRMNAGVEYLYSTYDPAVIRMVKFIVESAHANGIFVGICGEAASDPLLLPIWIGLSVDELSMSPGMILRIKKQITELTKSECEAIAKEVLAKHTVQEIEEYLKHVI